jgi:putative tryptophan/tyrosine transport system substrate-binding protein
MRRREFIALVGSAAVWPTAAYAQSAAIPVIGLLTPEAPISSDVDGLREGLRQLGYTEGSNLHIEYRFAKGNFDQLAQFAKELVALKVDLIVSFVTQASIEAKKATATTPIVMVGVADPIGSGLIASFNRPGTNVTGTSSVATDVVSKQLGLLKEIVPDVNLVAALWNPADPVFQAQQRKQTESAAEKLGLQLQFLEARSANEFEAAFAAVEGTQVLFILIDPLFINNTKTLAQLSLKYRLVSIFGYRTFADAGGLMAYGPNYFDIYKRAALYVDKILKGARSPDLPATISTFRRRFGKLLPISTASSGAKSRPIFPCSSRRNSSISSISRPRRRLALRCR